MSEWAGVYEFDGNPAEVLPRVQAMLTEFASVMVQLVVLVTEKSVIIYDVCPSKGAVQGFQSSPTLESALTRHRLPRPRMSAYPVGFRAADGRIR
jgi:hypothetical protein